MTISYTRKQSVLIDNQQCSSTVSINSDGIIQQSPLVPSPKTGTVTTYTDTNTATLTMASGHGITTGAKFDLYYAGGVRYNCVAGTVSGNTVPFTGGTNANIPPLSTVISAMVPQSYNFFFVWSDIQTLVCSSQKVPYPVRATIHFITDTASEASWPFVALDGVSDYVWDYLMLNKPLLAITDIVTIKISHDDVNFPQTISVNAMFQN